MLTLRDELLAALERVVVLRLVLAVDELRLELELLLFPLLTLRVELELPLDTLRLELLPDTLRDTLELLLFVLRVELELVLLGRS